MMELVRDASTRMLSPEKDLTPILPTTRCSACNCPEMLNLPTTNGEHVTGDTTERANLAQAQMSLAAVLEAEVPSKNKCAQVASDHEAIFA